MIFKTIIILLMTCATLQSQEEQTSTQHYPVGELGALWQFPSDHLPIGGSIGDIHFAMWNILSTHFLSFIEDNGQGLRDSLIKTSNIPVQEGKSLTVREQMIIDQVLQMFEHKTHPRALIALEETNDTVFQELNKIAPPNMVVIMPLLTDPHNRDIFIYNSDRFSQGEIHGIKYDVAPKNVISEITLKDKQTGLEYRFIQSHVPGGPVNSPAGRKQFSEYVINEFDPEKTTIIMGDMNRSADYFQRDFATASQNRGLAEQPYENKPIPYPTHIDTNRDATWIDNLFIYNPYAEISVQITTDPSEFFEGLRPTMDLLKEVQSH